MADEQQTPEEGTPAPEAPEVQEPTENWKERYANLQPEYTRATQEAAQLRQQLDALRSDPEAQQQFLAELGYELDLGDDEPEPDDDPVAELRKEFEGVKQTLTQAEQERQIKALDDHFAKSFQEFGKERGSDLTEDEQAALVGLALTMEPENGMPPAKKAWEALERIRTAQLEAWAKTKNPAHRVSPTGAEGIDTPDLDDDATRRAWMAQRLADLNNAA